MAFSDQLGFSFERPGRRVWTVRELVAAVRTHVEREYSEVWVEGEISNFRPAESGHLYFTLKDGDAQIRIVMFRAQARLLRFRPENGMQVIARGRVTVYEARGELQISAEMLEPRGAGALQVAFEQLKAKLAAEGLFDRARKKPIPALPRRVGLVTSPRGAALQDILNVLRRRHQSLNIVIYPAQVQGETAAGEVSAGVRYFSRAKNVDVILVARGGGSLEDLAAFNHEGLARAIAGSEVPVISAVGHETDFTIADFVADLRAPTPSAAAEMVVESERQLQDRLESLRTRLARAMRYQVLMSRQRLTQLAQHGAFARMREAINRRQQRLDDLVFRLATVEREKLQELRRRIEVASARLQLHDPRRSLHTLRREVDGRVAALAASARKFLLTRRAREEQLTAQLQALSPLNILERGYALVFDAAGKLVKEAEQVKPGDEIRARVHRGEFKARVSGKD